jgi:uncharacterized membrane protein YhaH (DUF805 family)
MQVETKLLNLWELYFTTKGRLSRKDFGWYYFLPSTVLVFVGMVLLAPGNVKGDELFVVPSIQVLIYSALCFSIVATAKRARDFNAPGWCALIPYFIASLVIFIPAIIPSLGPAVDTLLTKTSSFSVGILVAFWSPQSDDASNEYGPPCKVVFFKRQKTI